MKKTYLLFIPVALTFAGIYTACKKQAETEGGDQRSELAGLKTWFKNEIVDKEAVKLNSIPTNTPGDVLFRKYARMGKMAKKLDWSHASTFDQNGFNFTMVHVADDQEITNKNFSASRYLVFYENHSGKQMKVLEILNHSRAKLLNEAELAKTAFLNMYHQTGTTVPSIHASFIFYDREYRTEKGFLLKNNTWKALKIELSNLQTPRKKLVRRTINQRTTCQTCTMVYLIGFWYDTYTGEVVDYFILDEWPECNDTYIPYGGGEDPGGNEVNQCVEDAINNASQMWAGAEVVFQPVSESSSGTGLIKNKDIKWVCLKSPTWVLWSYEKGTVELVDAQTNKWQWKTLVHDRIEFSGTSYGGSISHTNGVGTASFVPGTPNVLYAGMEVKFNVTYSPVCKCPGIDLILPPTTIPYTSTGIWDAIPR